MNATTLQEWKATNPLRRWRTQTGTTATLIASKLEVSKITVMHWEKGDKTPRPPRLAAIGRIIGVPNIRSQWLHWLAEKPE